MIALYTPKKSNHLRLHSRAIMALDHSRLGLENNWMRPNFLGSISLLYKILPTNLGVCKPTFYTFYTSHLRWNSTMRRCIYHTDLEQNAVFHNFSRQIALSQYSGRGNFQNHPYSQPVLTFDKRQICNASCNRLFEWTLIELGFKIIKNLLWLFFFI